MSQFEIENTKKFYENHKLAMSYQRGLDQANNISGNNVIASPDGSISAYVINGSEIAEKVSPDFTGRLTTLDKKIHFIAGLPRSGTTLLSTILKQNPRFDASISGPLARYFRAVIHETTAQGGYGTECPPDKVKAILRSIFNSYYSDSNAETVFNVNRGWPLLRFTTLDMFPKSKLILCVRDIEWVIDSFEVLFRKNPYSFTSMFSPDEGINVYTRANTLINPGRTIGFAYTAIKQAITSDAKSSIFIIKYDDLAKNPGMIINALYNFIGEPLFEHDYSNVEASYDEFDAEVNLPGLHTTRRKVEYIPRELTIPPDLVQMLRQNLPSVWG